MALREAMCCNCADEFTFVARGGKARPLCETCEVTYKWCPGCGYALVHEAFGSDTRARGGLDGRCKQCKNAAGRARENTKWKYDPRKSRAHKIMTRYNLTQEQFDALVVSQSGKCAICDRPSPDIHIDHCHATGRVRGLLCPPCNKGLGHFGDDIDRMTSALVYLMAGEG